MGSYRQRRVGIGGDAVRGDAGAGHRRRRVHRQPLAAAATSPALSPQPGGPPRQAFLDHYRTGCALAADAKGGEFRRRFDALAAATTPAAWAGLIGLCRAIAEPAFDGERAAGEYAQLAALFPDGLGE